jgi:transmembrane sensor
VWLNAASSLTYPTTFNSGKREVTLKGEAFFEVTHQPNRPFIVHTDRETIEDLSTRFDVMAYDNEDVQKTTLVKGAIRVSGTDQQSTVLHPGQQARSAGKGALTVASVEPEVETAWMNNEFKFQDVDLYSAMRQIERWYDVQVVYRGKVPNRPLRGSAARDAKLSRVLAALRVVNLHYQLNDRIVTIEP